jgi:hypothetical protein
MVYVGNDTVTAKAPPTRGSAAAFRDSEQDVKVRKTVPLAVLLSQFDEWSIKRKRQIGRRLARAGLIDIVPQDGETVEEYMDRITLSHIRAGYQYLLELAAQAHGSNPQTKITPQRVMDQYTEYNKGKIFAEDGGPTGSRSVGGIDVNENPYPLAGKTKKQTVKQIDIFSPRDAEGLARAVMERELGRIPTEEEYADFVSALNAEMRDNPTKTVTTTKYGARERVKSQTTRSSGGLSESGINNFATEWAEDQPGAAEWQAIGTYLPAVMQALGAAVPGT